MLMRTKVRLMNGWIAERDSTRILLDQFLLKQDLLNSRDVSVLELIGEDRESSARPHAQADADQSPP